MLYGNLSASICSNTGIIDSDDVIKLILAGADAVQVVGTLYNNGISHLSSIIKGIETWMDKKGYASIEDFRGKMSKERLGKRDPWIYKRAQYIKMLMQSSDSLMNQILD